MTEFKPEIKGIEREGLFKYQDELGDVYLDSAGIMPEFGFCFYYKDAKYEFCFYARSRFDSKESGVEIFDVEVNNATFGRFRGSRPKIDPADFDRIVLNMTKFFSERSFSSPRRPVPPTEKLRSVKLLWVLP